MNFSNIRFAVIATGAMLMAACGGGGGGGGGDPAPAAPTTYPRYAFASNAGDGTISVYSVDPGTGQLRHRHYVTTGAGSAAVGALDPTGKFLIVTQSSPSALKVLPVDAATGALGAPATTLAGHGCRTPLFDAAGKYLYCSEGTFLYSYAIDADGKLTELPGSPLGAPTDNWYPSLLAMSPSGKFILAADQNLNQVLSFEINPADGTIINATNGTLVPNGSAATFIGVAGVIVDPAGKYVYVASSNGPVTAYRLDGASGALELIDAVEGIAGIQAAASGDGAGPMVFDRSGSLLLVANTGAKTISVFRLNPATGAIAHVDGSPFATGVALNNLALDPTGKFLYTTDGSDNRVTRFSFDAATGAVAKAERIGARSGPGAMVFSRGSSPVSDTPRAVYVANRSSNDVSQFSVGAGGTLAAMGTASVAAGTSPRSVAVDPFGRFAYVANYVSNNVSVYAINADTRALTEVTGSPFPAGTSPTAVSTDPSGRFVYVSNYGWPGAGSVSAYTVDGATGALSVIAGAPFAAGNGSDSIAVDPSGRFAYVTNLLNDTMTLFSINPATGALTQIDADTGTAGVQSLIVTNARPISVTSDSRGHFVYVATACGGTWVFGIDAISGRLSRVDADAGGLCFGAPGAPNIAAAETTGRYLYSGEFSGAGTVRAFGIDAASGALTALPGSPWTTGGGTVAVTADSSGRYVYAAGSAGVYPFKTASDGTLTSLGSATAAGSSPASIATVGSVQ